ncbi:mycofactocin biosynthesis peptidyl-dipeptidase MftE [Herbiconiux solani]|uniref:mycofactocin biosynthesis peptidyl-dipeptidase MftE n=1 Tax=Herbiconiux solani TaxID=661329 RepID=UPI001C3F2E43|nr:mycofactocin biosynthesis peptidyl-dipeptidase MftE [Herbiconiux solani]
MADDGRDGRARGDAPRGDVLLGGMAWPELPERPLVLVPVGATEQHGPHLPFDTDSVIAAETAEAVATRLVTSGRSVVVTPALAFGASGEHQSFAGTVSIGQEALRAVVIELVRSLSTWAGRIVLVIGHGGNMSTLVSAVPQLTDEGHDVSWVPCAPAGAPPEITDAHAGRLETSLMLFLRPGSVRQPLPGAGDTRPMRELLPLLTASGVGAVSSSGVLGDPTGATAEEGEELFASMTAEVERRIVRAQPDARGLLGRVGGRARHAGATGADGPRG